MTAPYTLTIGGVDHTAFLEQQSVKITSVTGGIIGTAEFSLYDKSLVLTPGPLSEVIITRNDLATRVFGGTSSILHTRTDGVSRWFDFQCQDFNRLLQDNYCLGYFPPTYVYAPYGSKGDKAIIQACFEQYTINKNGAIGGSSGIDVTSNVSQTTADSLSAINYTYNSLYEIVSSMASLVGSTFHVDANKTLNYYLSSLTAAPYDIATTPNWAAPTPIIGHRMLRYKQDGTNLKNAFMSLGTNLFSDVQTVNLPSDGVRTIIGLDQVAVGVTASLIGPPGYPYIRVFKYPGPAELTVGVKGVDTPGVGGIDVVYDASGAYLQFAVAPGNLNPSVQVKFRYQYGAATPGFSHDDGSIAVYGGPRFSRLVAGDANSAAMLDLKRAVALGRQKNPLNVATILLDDNMFPSTARFAVGQLTHLSNTILGLSSVPVVVRRITTTILGGTLKQYEIELWTWIG